MKAAYRVITASFALAATPLFAQAPAIIEQTTPTQVSATTITQTQAALPTQATAPTQNEAQVAAALAAAQAPPPDPAAEDAADSKVRIVRLSQVRGKTQIDRGVGNGMETAFTNLPITQGTKLQVDEGVAEVEFEDTSTLRLTPGTVVEFPRLSRSATGSTNNVIKVLKGTMYISLEKTKSNVYTLTCDRGMAVLSPGSQARLTLDTMQPGLAVLTGAVEFTNLDGSNIRIGKNKELMLAASGLIKADTLGEIEDYAYDTWYENQEDYHKHYSKGSALSASGSPYSYGLSDLNYYGAFADLPGCGNVWRPYFASAAWDPYGAGLWAWYPANGYSWVSPYPWGWAPFHYGSWMQCGGGMWGWAPGGGWTGLNNMRNPRLYPHPIHHPGQHDPPRHPFPVHPQPPHQGAAFRWVTANNKPLTFSGMNAGTHNFVFRNDSAGLGVPREMFGKLNKTAGQVNQHGPVNVPMMAVRSEPVHINNPEARSGAIAARSHESVAWLPASGGHEHSAWAPNNNGNNGSADGWAASHANSGSGWSNNHSSVSNNGGGWSGAHQSVGNNGGGDGGWSGGGHSSGSVSAGGGGGGFSGGSGGGGHMGSSGGAPAGGGASAGGGAHH